MMDENVKKAEPTDHVDQRQDQCYNRYKHAVGTKQSAIFLKTILCQGAIAL